MTYFNPIFRLWGIRAHCVPLIERLERIDDRLCAQTLKNALTLPLGH